uniref:Uncharacterized protein n=1 Tax=Gorilla gorilla gorilla TaxID=9595 RepID=A0A2I2ZVN6_GORGO
MLPCFSAAKLGPLAPSGSASWGQGSCLGPPVWERWISSALHRAPSSPPSFPRGTALGWEGRTSPSLCPTFSLGTERAPTNLCLCLGGRGGLLPLGKAAGVCLQGRQLRAAPCIIQAMTSDLCLNQPWGLAPPALSMGA